MLAYFLASLLLAPTGSSIDDALHEDEDRACVERSRGITSNLMACTMRSRAVLEAALNAELVRVKSALPVRRQRAVERSQERWRAAADKNCWNPRLPRYGTADVLGYEACINDRIAARIRWLRAHYPRSE